MATPTPSAVAVDDNVLITPEADKELKKVLYTGMPIVIGVFVLANIAMPFVNVKGNPLFPYHKLLDLIGTFLAIAPMFFLVAKLNATKLKFARHYAETGEWKAVYGAVESFAFPMMRFQDFSGEAHYYLSIACERLGKKVKAEKSRQFVIEKRSSGEWAQKLIGAQASRAFRKPGEIQARRDEIGRKLTKTKRRF